MAAPKKKDVAKRKRKPPAKPVGRPTKLTKPVAARIAEAVSLGLSYRDAAMAGGVHENTLDSWRKRGAVENSIYARFIGQIDKVAEATPAGTTWPPRWCLPAVSFRGHERSPSAQPLTSA